MDIMDHSLLKESLARLMSLHTGFSVLLKESENSITKETILEKIEARAESLRVEPSVVALDLLVTRIRTLAQEVRKGQDFVSELEELAQVMECLVDKKVVVGTELEGCLLQEPLFLCLPLTALWRISCAKVVSLEQVIKSTFDSSAGGSLTLVDELLDLVVCQKGPRSRHTDAEITRDILGVLVSLAFTLGGDIGGTQEEWEPLAKFAGEVLQILMERVLEVVLENWDEKQPYSRQKEPVNKRSLDEQQRSSHQATSKDTDRKEATEASTSSLPKVINIYQLVIENPKVPQEALERFCSAQLVQVLTHRPNLKLGRVLRDQEAWCSAKANATLSSLLQKLVVGLGHEKALTTLELVLSNEEVNWACVLTLVATALTCHRDTVAKIKELIERNIQKGCEELETEHLIVGFLFARHAAQEGPHIFPSYANWFSALFAPEATSPVARKQSFVFLIKFLTEMVPHEPVYCLRAHLTTRVFTPKGCQETLRSYTHLARARLQELRDTLQDSKQRQSFKAKAIEEVEDAVKYFSENDKVPSFVLEASIFKEVYFRSTFLPTLLAPRHLPKVPDARAKLIKDLYTRGKITPTMLKNYNEECQKEASDLQSVFIDVKEDIIMEEPIEELSHLMEELVAVHHHHHGTDSEVPASDILPVLSKISVKIEEMMKGSDSRMRNAKHLTLDLRTYDNKLLSHQIVEHIIITVERMCQPLVSEGGSRERKGRPGYLSQLLSLISSSLTLQVSFFLLLLHHLTLQDLTKTQLQNDGRILYELSQIEGVFLPVVEVTQPNQEPHAFTSYYLHSLPLDTPWATHNACCILSSWLEWQVVCEGNACSFHDQVLHLYVCLAPRIPLILNHSEGNEATVADVYRYLEGSDVPDCSHLYFSNDIKGQDSKVPLKSWLHFELRATWGDVSSEIRQTFLYCCLLRHVSLLQQDVTASPPSLGELVTQLILLLTRLGLRQRNASDILMLIQTVGHQLVGEESVCLLEEWHKCFSRGVMDTSHTVSFMSICRCLSPSLFLRAGKLFELAQILETLVTQLVNTTDTVQLNLCDTSFLLASLLSAATSPSAKSLHVDRCLRPIRTAIMFHWDSLASLIRSYSAAMEKHHCLILLKNFITSNNIQSLVPDEAGIRLLALSLSQTISDEERKQFACCCGKSSYLKWLLAYLGLQQVKGHVPYLLDEVEELDITEKDRKVILWSHEELLRLLRTTNKSEKITEDVFPAEEEINLALRLIPVALVLVIVCGGEKQCGISAGSDIFATELLLILIQCHIFLINAFDTQNSDNNCVRYPNERWLPNLSYLVQLNQVILSYLVSSSQVVLGKIPKSMLGKCDAEVRATIYNRLMNKKSLN